MSNDLALRASLRLAHKAHVDQWENHLHLAGLLEDESGKAYVCSLFILRSDDFREAERFSDEDPFFIGGVFGKRSVSRFEKRRGWFE